MPTNVYTCPACPLAFEVGIANELGWDYPLFVCTACGTMHRVPVPAGRVQPEARHALQGFPGPVRSLVEEVVMVRTLREGIRTAEEVLSADRTFRDEDWT